MKPSGCFLPVRMTRYSEKTTIKHASNHQLITKLLNDFYGMKFLFHAVTNVYGIYDYWNIYLIQNDNFFFENLRKLKPSFKMIIPNACMPLHETSPIKESSAMSFINWKSGSVFISERTTNERKVDG